MATRTEDHKHYWKLWTVQLNAVSAALATTVGAAALADMPKEVIVVISGLILVTNALSAYVRTIVQSGLVDTDVESS